MPTDNLYIVWNEGKNEGVVFLDFIDAAEAAEADQEDELGDPCSSLGFAFVDIYGDGVRSIETIAAAARDVLAERRRQVDKGYDAAHDDEHSKGEIMSADWGALARLSGQAFEARRTGRMDDYRRLLVEGAAQVLAEIERIDRKAPHG